MRTTFNGIGRGMPTLPATNGSAWRGIGRGVATTPASQFAGIGRGAPAIRNDAARSNVFANDATKIASFSKPNPGQFADRLSVKHDHAMTDFQGTRRDAMIVRIGASKFSSQLHQSANAGDWVSIPVPSPDPDVSRNELGNAVLEAIRRHLPYLFAKNKLNQNTKSGHNGN
jgi:hypothetical protein